MRYLILATAAAILASAPAHATGGVSCKTASDPQIAIDVGFGHTAGAALFSRRLHVGDEEIAVDAPQWWLDDTELRLVLVDNQAMERLAVVHATRNGATYDGSVRYNGQQHWIRCYES